MNSGDDAVGKEILGYAGEKGMLLNEQALGLLRQRMNWREIVDELSAENLFVVKAADVERKTVKTKVNLFEKEVSVESSAFRPESKDTEANFRIMEEYDVTGKSYSEGTIKDFLAMFHSKFETLSEILKKRHTLKPKPISRLKSVSLRNEIDVIGMVFEKWVSKKGHLAIKIEDMEGTCIALIPKDDQKLKDARDKIIADDVIGIRGTKISDDMIIVKDVFWPDLPQRNTHGIGKDLRLAGLSDIHIGSKKFLEKEFGKFIEWINGKGLSGKEAAEVGKIKYITITGDNVDGIGVYPGQYDDLAIKDINRQYEVLTDYLLQIPEYIEVFVIPGNHDAVRNADPQPALPKKIVPELYGSKNIHLIGSPGWVEIEGLKTLLYHGGSMHDLFASVSGLNSSQPEKGMIELLKRRDLMPSYGMKHPYVPEKKDYMIIREEPDMFFTGDLHHNGYGHYRGVLAVNSGTWQSRTDYQVRLGHYPTPGVVPVIDLRDLSVKENSFCSENL